MLETNITVKASNAQPLCALAYSRQIFTQNKANIWPTIECFQYSIFIELCKNFELHLLGSFELSLLSGHRRFQARRTSNAGFSDDVKVPSNEEHMKRYKAIGFRAHLPDNR